MAMPLGNLGPYFILSVSTTFFDISTKPLLSLIPYLKKKKIIQRNWQKPYIAERREAIGYEGDVTPLGTSGMDFLLCTT